ncbi:Phosphatidylinositol 4-kinase beta [Aphanomyces cochlioides]|nr:Phosphatidylinositol 4-kinase beta [Aphanomyces cochlioides]
MFCCGRQRLQNGPLGDADEDDEHNEVDRVELFRRFWDGKLKEVADLISGRSESASSLSEWNPRNMFHVTLQLYAHKDVVDQLYSCFEENPDEVEFYIPQLCTFLLHGQYDKNPALEFFLLSQCRRSLHFAHRLHWFLQSFCANGSTYKSEGLSATVDKYSAENGQLLLEIAKQGGVPAKLFSMGLNEEEVDTPELSDTRDVALQLAEESIQSPEQIALYDTTPAFLKALTDLADRLIGVPLMDRKVHLRQGLAEIEAKFFPASTIYLPVGDAMHRIKSVLIDECFPFSTKERVPYLVCVEVVDYAQPHSSTSRSRRSSSASNNHSFSYTMKLPFNKTVTLAMSSSNDDNQSETGTTAGTGATTATGATTSTASRELASGQTPPSTTTTEATSASEKSPRPHDTTTTKTFVVESLKTSFTVSIRGRNDDDSSDDSDSRNDDEDEEEEPQDPETKAAMGQWAHRKRKRSNAKYAKQRMVEVKSKESAGDQDALNSRTKMMDMSPTAAWDETSGVIDEETPDAAQNYSTKPVIAFRERWSEKQDRLRSQSAHGSLPGWRLVPVIIKSNDDLRQEQLAAQLIAQCHKIFQEAQLPLKLRPYAVIATSATCGLIEAVPDTVSLDSLKKNDPNYTTLSDFYERYFGPRDGSRFKRARRHFVESLAAYSIVCYIFQIKDRHNGNILVDAEGHLIHIDFGFLFTNSPGGNIGFESAPFKLTDEFVELLDGPRSALFRHFRSLCVKAYWALHLNMDKLVLLVEMMLVNDQPEFRLPCFIRGKKETIDGLRDRLNPGLGKIACQEFVNELIDQSLNNWRTRWYDKYQYCCMGIL